MSNKYDVTKVGKDKYLIKIDKYRESLLKELDKYNNHEIKKIKNQLKGGKRKCFFSKKEAIKLTKIMEKIDTEEYASGGDKLFYALLEIKYWDY